MGRLHSEILELAVDRFIQREPAAAAIFRARIKAAKEAGRADRARQIRRDWAAAALRLARRESRFRDLTRRMRVVFGACE